MWKLKFDRDLKDFLKSCMIFESIGKGIHNSIGKGIHNYDAKT